MHQRISTVNFLFFVLLTTIVFLHAGRLNAQQKYDAALIDSALLRSANGVIRDYTMDFEIKDEGSAVKKVKYAVTILNKQGEHFGVFNEMYHQFVEVKRVDGMIYDGEGALVRELKKNDFNDVSAISGFSLYEDNRRKYISPVTNFFPYTVVYEYEIIYDGLFHYPTWYPVTDYQLALEKASLTVTMPEELSLRYKLQQMNDPVTKSNDKKHRVYAWDISRITAYNEEPYSVKLDYRVPAVYLAPERFEIDGYEGNLLSWKDFGLWVKKLNDGRDKLKNRSREEIYELLTASEDTLERIRMIYDYVQSRTRYVNIKLGIGGYQPHEAQLVHDVGYGDCKALTNYTRTLLEIAGIKSYYALVKAGSEASDIMTDFPSAQFNHAFLCVPYKDDTIWLECSSQVTPFNYLGSFTDDRHVLLITEEGGVLAKTPSFDVYENRKVTSGKFNLDKNGDATGMLKILYQGVFYDDVANMANMGVTEQKAWLYENLSFPSFTIGNFSVINRKNNDPPEIELTVHLNIDKFAGTSNKRLFIPVNILSTVEKQDYSVDELSDARTSPLLINRSLTRTDSLTITYPEGYQTEYIPEAKNVTNGVGVFSTEYANHNNTIHFYRHKIQQKGEYVPEKLSEWNVLLENQNALNKLKIVLVNEGIE